LESRIKAAGAANGIEVLFLKDGLSSRQVSRSQLGLVRAVESIEKRFEQQKKKKKKSVSQVCVFVLCFTTVIVLQFYAGLLILPGVQGEPDNRVHHQYFSGQPLSLHCKLWLCRDRGWLRY